MCLLLLQCSLGLRICFCKCGHGAILSRTPWVHGHERWWDAFAGPLNPANKQPLEIYTKYVLDSMPTQKPRIWFIYWRLWEHYQQIPAILPAISCYTFRSSSQLQWVGQMWTGKGVFNPLQSCLKNDELRVGYLHVACSLCQARVSLTRFNTWQIQTLSPNRGLLGTPQGRSSTDTV